MPLRPDLHMVYLIARREFTTRVRSRFFIFGTILFAALLAGYIILQAVVISRVTTTVKVGFSGDAAVLAQPLKAAAAPERVKIDIHQVASAQEGEAQVRDGKLDAAVSGDAASPEVAVQDQLDPTVQATLSALVKQAALNRALKAAGADPGTIEAKVAAADIHLTLLDPNAAERTQRDVVGIFIAALLYVSLLLYGQFVAQGVVEEKANRIVEILLSTVKARHLLFGKVIGIGLVGLLQLTVLGLVALATISRFQVISLPNIGVEAVVGGLLWYVLGFIFYALIFAAAGSMVSRQEDIGQVTGPLSMLVVGTYLAFFWVVANPDNPVAVVLSVIPPFDLVIMPGRMATGDAEVWQVLVSVALTVAAIIGLNILAARIYTNSVLRIGTRVRFSQAWRGVD
ncbi:MAG TPA: ABC transporter permease [Candidatus Dormibacteraeota bacterium]